MHIRELSASHHPISWRFPSISQPTQNNSGRCEKINANKAKKKVHKLLLCRREVFLDIPCQLFHFRFLPLPGKVFQLFFLVRIKKLDDFCWWQKCGKSWMTILAFISTKRRCLKSNLNSDERRRGKKLFLRMSRVRRPRGRKLFLWAKKCYFWSSRNKK